MLVFSGREGVWAAVCAGEDDRNNPVLVELEKCLWSTRLIGEVPEQEDDEDPTL